MMTTQTEAPSVVDDVGNVAYCNACKGLGVVRRRRERSLRPCGCLDDATRWRRALIPPRFFFAPPRPLPAGGSAIVVGPPGRGKTRYAVGVLKTWTAEMLGGIFVDLHALEMQRRAAVGEGRSTDAERYVSAAFLVADDLGRGRDQITEYWREYLHELVVHRYNNNLPTVWTSNFTLDELRGRIGDYIVSRIVEMTRGNVMTMTGKDWRTEKDNA